MQWRPAVYVLGLLVVVLGAGAYTIRSRSERASDHTPAVHDHANPAPAADAAATDAAFGFSHTFRSLINGKMVVTMREGPEGEQVRCQSEALPCSYLALKKLSRSGAPVPADLHMTREELRQLVAQLDVVSGHLGRYRHNVDQACADGYRTRSSQVANMGIHMSKPVYMRSGFDLRKPQILLFAAEGNEQRTQKDVGDCVNGKWTGDPRQEIVGAAFIQFTEDHPEGFAGPLDNWHIHYGVCIGTLSAAALSEDECKKHGGSFLSNTGWMVHVYAVPEFDNQVGVFSQWNPSVWPKSAPQAMAAMAAREMPGHGMPGHQMAGHDVSGAESVIFEFRFSPVEIEAGETVVFRNADPVFHSITSGTAGAPTGLFDSGKLFNDQTFAVKLDKPGTYPIFCRLHPDMTGTIVVK
jgi:plastocyanin